jgi:hypothetical protein
LAALQAVVAAEPRVLAEPETRIEVDAVGVSIPFPQRDVHLQQVVAQAG